MNIENPSPEDLTRICDLLDKELGTKAYVLCVHSSKLQKTFTISHMPKNICDAVLSNAMGQPVDLMYVPDHQEN